MRNLAAESSRSFRKAKNTMNLFNKITDNDMKKTLASLLLLSCLWAISCSQKEKNAPASADQGATEQLTAAPQEEDSTYYGKADDFGMSTFTLVTDERDTLEVSRTVDEKGNEAYGEIYGDLKPDDRYAMTTRDNNEALGVLINLSQLEKFTKDYEVRNGHLVLLQDGKADTVRIVLLTDKAFKAKGRSGKTYQMSR